jgi:general secretion pathway protein G
MLRIHSSSLGARKTPARHALARGFTLIELLVVMAIVALLAGIVGPRVLEQFDKSKAKAAKVQIADLEKALDLFKLDVGRYPTSEEGLDALAKRPGSAAQWAGPYLRGDGVPPDPWGNAYKYANPGPKGGVEILSLGADKAPGGEGENTDIRNQQ